MFGNGEVFIIAEAGVNHNGSLELAKELIDVAKWAGVNAVKFQTWKTENVITKDAKMADYQLKRELHQQQSQYEMLKKLELAYADFDILKSYCDSIGIMFMSTADEFESLSYINKLISIIKVGSAELTDLPFLRKVAVLNKPVILSTGMACIEEVKDAVDVITAGGLPRDKIVLLHANSEYPTPYQDVNLRAMVSMGQKLAIKVGYSDHTLGIEVPIAAVAMGACVIEKHFTLDRTMEGPDHAASLNPKELKAMTAAIRNIESALGSAKKRPSPSESKNVPVIRKSIVARTRIRKGEIFSEDNITVKRPGIGLSPKYWDKIIGTPATKDYGEDEFIILD